MAQENIDRIWNQLSAVSKEARNAAKKKCKEKELDANKGIIGLEESLNNLGHIREVLKDAIETRKLIQFPYSFQIELEKKLTTVVKHLNDLSEGIDTIEPLVIEIDQLFYLIWLSRIENVTPEVLGYQDKMNKVKALELDLEKLKAEFEAGLELKEQIKTLKDSIDRDALSSTKMLEGMKENSKKVEDAAGNVASAQQEASAKLVIVNTSVSALESSLAAVKGNAITVESTTKAIKDFYASIEENRTKIDQNRVSAETIVAENSAETKKLLEKLSAEATALATKLIGDTSKAISDTEELASKTALTARTESKALLEKIDGDIAAVLLKLSSDSEKIKTDLIESTSKIINEIESNNKAIVLDLQRRENDIKDQMAKVTGLGLFGSFRRRMEDVVGSKTIWIWGVALTLLSIVGLTAVIAWTFKEIDGAFYLKLSIYMPLLIGIIFCTKNYGHERQLEEEYAFKSSISLSLVPFKELVEKSTGDKEKYADFLIGSINNIFTSPTDKVFSNLKDEGLSKFDKGIDKNLARLKDLAEASRSLNPISDVVLKK